MNAGPRQYQDVFGLVHRAPDPSIERIVRLAAMSLRTRYASFVLDLGDVLFVAAHHGLEQGFVPKPNSPCGEVVATHKPLLVEDLHEHPTFQHHALVKTGPPLRFYAGIPIADLDGGVLGCLSVVDSEPRRFAPSELDLLAEWSGMVGDALATRSTSIRDGLTGLYNRRFFDEQLAIALRRGVRMGTATSVALIDVDYFKQYNDSEGHCAGDQALRALACALEAIFRRPSDIVARYGGEEFAILLEDTGATEVAILVERARTRLDSLGIAHGASPIGRLTFSTGMATHRTLDANGARLVSRADAMLYQAKRGGRNRSLHADASSANVRRSVIQPTEASTAVMH